MEYLDSRTYYENTCLRSKNAALLLFPWIKINLTVAAREQDGIVGHIISVVETTLASPSFPAASEFRKLKINRPFKMEKVPI